MFDSINRLLFDKKKDITSDMLDTFTPYMVNRYFSFYGPEYVQYINESLNMYSDLFEDDKEKFDYYDNIIPKLRKKKIQYVKRPKDERTKEEFPVPDFYSKKEIETLTNMID